MRVDEKLLIKNLATTANLINTINGGMAEPVSVVEEFDTAWKWQLKMPSVDIDTIKIELKDGMLMVFQMLTESNHDFELPNMLGHLMLTSKIDVELIYAEYQNGTICIHLPFNEAASDFEKEIEIFKK